jgi:predicted P-loop ATPase
MLIACVTRVYEPGHKFDFALILSGPQGCRKSTFVKTLCKSDKWFGEIDCKLDDRQAVAEQIGGKLILELPEGASITKSSASSAKAFMRREDDDVRMAYDRRVSTFKRQCVFFGTINDAKYLKDPTGNRSYWPVPVQVGTIDTVELRRNMDQIWAEANVRYQELRKEFPKKTDPILPLFLSPEADIQARILQEAARSEEMFEEWATLANSYLDEPVLLSELLAYHEQMVDVFYDEEGGNEVDPEKTWVVRCAWAQDEIMVNALGLHGGAITNYQQKAEMEKAYPVLEQKWEKPVNGMRRFGKLRRWWVRKDATYLEKGIGYKIVPEPIDSLAPEFSDIW